MTRRVVFSDQDLPGSGRSTSRVGSAIRRQTPDWGLAERLAWWLLPLKKSLPLDQNSDPRPAPGGATKLVLLVEDEPLLLKSAERMLTLRGFAVLSAPDAASAIHAAVHAPSLALLLTDISLPGIDGRELAARLRMRHPGLPVLFMSGFDADQSLVSLPDDGTWAFLSKPFTGRDLDQALLRLLGSAVENAPARRR